MIMLVHSDGCCCNGFIIALVAKNETEHESKMNRIERRAKEKRQNSK